MPSCDGRLRSGNFNQLLLYGLLLCDDLGDSLWRLFLLLLDRCSSLGLLLLICFPLVVCAVILQLLGERKLVNHLLRKWLELILLSFLLRRLRRLGGLLLCVLPVVKLSLVLKLLGEWHGTKFRNL